ncbi:hypothetical protein FQR65_LT12749 [Abscondita terminalis]|nr:hypothetical protein FQR65_LT12749 [Abscondita terminalis]
MGHTEKTHNEFYKLPQDIYQTAKVSKLLILMDKGGGHKYKGKSLNEIDINPEVDLAESDNEEETESTITNMNIVVDHFEGEASTSAECRKAVKKTGRTPWSSAQIHLVKKEFKSHIDKKQAPKKHECEEFLKKHPHLFKDKDWVRSTARKGGLSRGQMLAFMTRHKTDAIANPNETVEITSSSTKKPKNIRVEDEKLQLMTDCYLFPNMKITLGIIWNLFKTTFQLVRCLLNDHLERMFENISSHDLIPNDEVITLHFVDSNNESMFNIH